MAGSGGRRGAVPVVPALVVAALLVAAVAFAGCQDRPGETVVGGDPGGSVVDRIDTVPVHPGTAPPPGPDCAATFAFPLEDGRTVQVEQAAGNGGVVRAGSVASFPLAFGSAARAHIVLRARGLDEIDASFPRTRFRRIDFGGPALTAALEAPADGPVTIENRGATDQDVIAVVLVETVPERCPAAASGG
jgi:hypothetical protein